MIEPTMSGTRREEAMAARRNGGGDNDNAKNEKYGKNNGKNEKKTVFHVAANDMLEALGVGQEEQQQKRGLTESEKRIGEIRDERQVRKFDEVTNSMRDALGDIDVTSKSRMEEIERKKRGVMYNDMIGDFRDSLESSVNVRESLLEARVSSAN